MLQNRTSMPNNLDFFSANLHLVLKNGVIAIYNVPYFQAFYRGITLFLKKLFYSKDKNDLNFKVHVYEGIVV